MDAPVIQKSRGFLSTLVLGITWAFVVLVVSCAAVVLYAMHLVDRKTDTLLGAAEQAMHGLPELRKNLPPVLADLLSDRRRPGYRESLALSATLQDLGRDDLRAVVEARNDGREVVSLLSVRLMMFDEAGRLLTSWNEWPATPVAGDDSWRGPLLPGSRRTFSSRVPRGHRSEILREGLRVEVEVTDLRIWSEATAIEGREMKLAESRF